MFARNLLTQTRVGFRWFSQTEKAIKYASLEHKEGGLIQRKKLEKLHRHTDFHGSPNSHPLAKQKPPKAFSKQHPINMDSSDTHVISYKKPARPLTPRYSIPLEAVKNANIPFKSPTGSKFWETILVGPPNAGKSTLINTFLDSNVTAVSDKSGTTDELRDFYFTKGKTQVKLWDTPGVITANNLSNSKHLITKWWNAIPLSDLTIFVVDAVKKIDPTVKKAIHRLSQIEVDRNAKDLFDRMGDKNFDIESFEGDLASTFEDDQPQKVPVNSVLVMNKWDLVSNRRRFNYLKQELEDIGRFDFVFNVSARTGFGMEELLEYILSQATRKDWEIHPDLKSSMTEIDKCSEIMKQAVYKNFFYEIPYRVGVDCSSWVPKTNGELLVDYKLSVPRESTKGIIIGKKARILRGLREEVQAELSKLYQKPVQAWIQVVVEKNYSQPTIISRD